MKTRFLALALVLASLGAYAQGKMIFGNDSLHLIVFHPFYLTPDYWPYAGQPVPQSVFPSFTAQVYAGTSPSTMTLQLTRSGSEVGAILLDPGRLASANFVLGGVPGGEPAYFQVLLFETVAGSYDNAVANYFVHGGSPVFTATPGPGLAYNSMVIHGGPSFSTWPDAPIVLSTIPEPSSVALATLGVIALLAQRRGRCSLTGFRNTLLPADRRR